MNLIQQSDCFVNVEISSFISFNLLNNISQSFLFANILHFSLISCISLLYISLLLFNLFSISLLFAFVFSDSNISSFLLFKSLYISSNSLPNLL